MASARPPPKGVEDWVAELAPDCICMQEIKAQASDIEGRFEEMAGLKGHFHFAEKKGYSGVGVYTKHEPSEVIVGWGSPSSTPRAATSNCASTRPQAQASRSSAATFPSGSSGEERQQAKFRFLRASTRTCWRSRRSASSCCAATSTSRTRRST
jgi:exodeoxyribonuclease-3